MPDPAPITLPGMGPHEDLQYTIDLSGTLDLIAAKLSTVTWVPITTGITLHGQTQTDKTATFWVTGATDTSLVVGSTIEIRCDYVPTENEKLSQTVLIPVIKI